RGVCWQHDLITGSHGLEHLALGLGALLIHPYGLDRRLDLLEGRHPAGTLRFDPHQMPTQSGLDGSLPLSLVESRQRLREARPEYAGNLIGRPLGVKVLEHERVGESSWSRCFFRLA